MPATAAWLASAEALLNRCIDSSAQAGALARRLQGTSLQIDVEGVTRIRAIAHQGHLAQLHGNAEIANQYRELFMLARPDPEEELSRWIGDIAARRLSEFARH